MILKLTFSSLVITSLALTSQRAYSLEASLAIGLYEPNDSVVNGIYKPETPCTMLQVGHSRSDGLSWSSNFLYCAFESVVANLENDTQLIILSTGFRKTFYEKLREKRLGLEPFLGLNIGAATVLLKFEDEALEENLGEASRFGLAASWEIGLNITNVYKRIGLEAKLTSEFIDKKLFGNISIGGHIFSIGLTYDFSDEPNPHLN